MDRSALSPTPEGSSCRWFCLSGARSPEVSFRFRRVTSKNTRLGITQPMAPPKTQGNPPTNMSPSSEVLVRREREQAAQRPMGIKWEKPRHRENIIYSEGKWEENRHLPWSQAALQTESEFQVSTQFRFRSLNEGESTVLNVRFLTLGRQALTAEALLWFT